MRNSRYAGSAKRGAIGGVRLADRISCGPHPGSAVTGPVGDGEERTKALGTDAPNMEYASTTAYDDIFLSGAPFRPDTSRSPRDACHPLWDETRPRAVLPCPGARLRVGGNLVPMAYQWPDSTFVGIDLSGGSIAEGSRTVAAIGLKNVRLRQLDIMEVRAEFGEFDYIIAHGVYSWVPQVVREEDPFDLQDESSPAGGRVRELQRVPRFLPTRDCPGGDAVRRAADRRPGRKGRAESGPDAVPRRGDA